MKRSSFVRPPLEDDKRYQAMRARMKVLRKSLKMTQAEVARLAEISAYQYGEIERGRSRGDILSIARIAEALGVNIDYLVYGVNADPDPHVENIRREIAQMTPEQRSTMSRYLQIMQTPIEFDHQLDRLPPKKSKDDETP